MDGQCFTTSAVGPTSWEVCLFGTATASRSSDLDTALLDWEGMEELTSGTLRFKWSSGPDCELMVEFRCDGEDAIVVSDPSEGFEFIGPQCGRIHGWIYSPQACRLEPGDDGVATNPVGYTDLFWTIGQFLDHDLDLTPESQLAEDKQPGFTDTRADEEFPIFVPEGDFYFSAAEELEFKRSVQVPDDGNPVKFINKHSAYIDLGQVYGQDFARANALRTHTDGLLKLHGAGFLPKNKLTGPDALGAKLNNAPDSDDKFFVAGDIRANEQITLLSMHTLWAREHNLVATELKPLFPDFGDKQLFETARAIVISCWQSIVYTEYLPLLTGSAVLPGDYRYDEEIDPGVTAFFSTVAYRYGHSMVPSQLWRVPAGGSHVLVPLREAFFNPDLLEIHDVEPFVRGAALHECRNIDDKANDEIRNFLFTEDTDSPHMDLISLNIQRARDMGLPTYNDAREAYDLERYTEWSQINDNPFVWRPIARVYRGEINDCDAFVCGLAEKKINDLQLGELFFTAMVDQFERCRDGDRFFYTGLDWDAEVLQKYPRLKDILEDKVKLHDIIVRNSRITMQELGMPGRSSVMST